jgi:hypothetical protein
MKKSSFKLMAALMVVLMLMTVVLVLPANAEGENLPTTLYVTKITKPSELQMATFSQKHSRTATKLSLIPQRRQLRLGSIIAAEPTGNANEFKVTYSKKFIENKEEEVTIPNGGFIYAAHCDDANKESDIYKKSSVTVSYSST